MRRVGLGCMRLSSPAALDPDQAIAVIHAALDAGVTLLDTADAYAPGADAGHNERLVARALASWSGDRARVQVATKGGLTRPGGRWVPDGRARHLVAAAEASRAALEVDAIDLYQLHAVDPKTQLSTSVRALAELRAAGVVRAIGLSNVSLGQLLEASRITAIDAVQVRLNFWDHEALHGGLVEHCRDSGIALLCHTPLGGRDWPRRAREPVLHEIAAKHSVSPAEVALAWLWDLAPVLVPLPGATRPESARSAAAGQALVLDEDDRRALDEQAPAGRIARVPRATRRPPPGAAAADVVLVMGSPAAGKSTWVRDLVERGYHRLNRDESGGKLADLAAALERGLAAGGRRFVLDNTYASRAARSRVVEAAWRERAEVRCVWLDTSLEDAQVNAAGRLLARHGRLPGPDELKRLNRRDPTMLPPRALFDYRRALEPPSEEEGFTAVEVVKFERAAPADSARALIVDAERLPETGEPLASWRADGWLLLAIAWRPGIAAGETTAAEVDAELARLRERLGLDDIVYCPHGPGPPVCWCRKPLPGLGALLVHRHRLDPSRCRFVGHGPADRGFAARLGLTWADSI
ncbi:MAG TPA: aldo/keto reductase [Kofleriaceae bacterium]|nr:aldo/keto reductase [Kofleriaceae bacterium]